MYAISSFSGAVFLFVIMTNLMIKGQPSLVLQYANMAVNEWQEGTQSSPVYYESGGQGHIIGSSYWCLYSVNADTGATNWLIQTTDGFENPDIFTPDLVERYETGILLLDSFGGHSPVFVVGAGSAELTVWSLTGDLLMRKTVDSATATNLGKHGSRITHVAGYKHPSNGWYILVGMPTTGMMDCCGTSGKYPNTWLLDSNLDEVWRRPVHGSQEALYTMGVFSMNHGMYDLTNDGLLEIIAPSDDYSVSVWKFNGDQAVLADPTQFPNADQWWAWVIFDKDASAETQGWSGQTSGLRPFFAHGIVTVLDVDNEPIVAVSGLYANGFTRRQGPDRYDHNTVFLLEKNRKRFVNSAEGWDWWESYEGCLSGFTYDSNMPRSISVYLSQADLTGDGYPEIIVSCTDHRVHVLGLNKQNIPGFPFALGDYIQASEVQIFQNPGECPSLIFTTYASSSISGTYFGEIFILDCQGQVVVQEDLPDPSGAGKTLSGSISGVSLFRKGYGTSTNLFAAIMTQWAGLVVYEIQNTENAKILWQTQKGNFQRTGQPVALADPFSGNDETTAEECSPPCTSHGVCQDLVCECQNYWGGNDCGTMICDPVCIHGRCSQTVQNTCECDAGWTNPSNGCNDAICQSGCENGNCIAPETCECDPGWSSASCNVAVCSQGCVHGTCSGPDTCDCLSGWTGSDCDTYTCDPSCENGGSCSGPNTCTCLAGFGGPTCSITNCNCVHGTCGSGPDDCSCDSGWQGTHCETPICSPACENGGTCVSPPSDCQCTTGWSGSSCSAPICDPVCEHGVCSNPSQCACLAGWSGDFCENVQCFTIDAGTTRVCSGHGDCIGKFYIVVQLNGVVGPNTCECDTDWHGVTCSHEVVPGAVCFGIDSSDFRVCSARGSCVELDTCECDKGFEGVMCEVLITCQGLDWNDFTNDVCSGNGVCDSKDTCKCFSGWKKDDDGDCNLKDNMMIILLAAIGGPIGAILFILFVACVIAFLILIFIKRNKVIEYVEVVRNTVRQTFSKGGGKKYKKFREKLPEEEMDDEDDYEDRYNDRPPIPRKKPPTQPPYRGDRY